MGKIRNQPETVSETFRSAPVKAIGVSASAACLGIAERKGGRISGSIRAFFHGADAPDIPVVLVGQQINRTVRGRLDIANARR